MVDLQLEPGELKGHLVVDGEIVELDHGVHCLFVEQQQLVGVLGELAAVPEQAPVEEQETVRLRLRDGADGRVPA